MSSETLGPRRSNEYDRRLDNIGKPNAIGGLPSFAITTPSTWPITSAAGYLFTLGTVTYS